MAQPKAEIRAVWLTTNGGSDWPKGEYSVSAQKQNLIEILDRLKEANFNTVVFQAQVNADVLWNSTIQPSLRYVTGNGSKQLSYDVSKFIIDECHARGMECHAWIVPYRVGSESNAKQYDSNPLAKHVSRLHPELCVTFGSGIYLDPGLPETRAYLLDVYREMITNYDFDGSNFDYTRYPGASFDDSESYAKYGNGMNKDDWRRQNINTFVHQFYDMAKSIKPGFKVGAAPIGTYKNVAGYGNMTAFGDVYQDACEWMQAGKHDLLIPQMYWNERYGFSPNMTTWVDNAAGRQLIVGLAPYKMVDTSNKWDVSVVTDQIEKVRAKAGMNGLCFFRTDHVIGTQTKIADLYNELQTNYFKYPAHIVPMDYNGITKPNAPTNVKYNQSGNKYTITWNEPIKDAAPVKYYCVYASAASPVDISDIKNCVGFAVTSNEFEFTATESSINFAVTAFDTNYYESDPATATSSIENVGNAIDTTISFDNNRLTIKGTNLANTEIFNITGIQTIQTTINDNVTTIDISALQSGIYIIKISCNDGSYSTHKILK